MSQFMFAEHRGWTSFKLVKLNIPFALRRIKTIVATLLQYRHQLCLLIDTNKETEIANISTYMPSLLKRVLQRSFYWQLPGVKRDSWHCCASKKVIDTWDICHQSIWNKIEIGFCCSAKLLCTILSTSICQRSVYRFA